MGRASYALRAPTLDEDRASLQKRLGRARVAPPTRTHSRPPRSIVRGVRLEADELIDGAQVALYPRHGRALVGSVMAITRRRVVLAAWGVRDFVSFDLRDVAFFRLVMEHSWHERHAITERQRKGEAAL